MINLKRGLFGLYVILVVSMVIFQWYKFIEGSDIKQPIDFNHKVHMEVADCDNCHKYLNKLSFAGIPTLADCMECHEDEPETDNPEEEKLFNYIDNKKTIHWKRLYKIPVHVYFSHKRHVSIGKIGCEKCHGDMGSLSKPPGKALVSIGMDFCIACHKKDNVETDCVTCHR